MKIFEKINERNKQKRSAAEAKRNFSSAMDYINLLIRYEPDKNNKILLLNYVLDTIKRDLKSEFQAASIYEFGNLRYIDTPFPYFYYDDNNIMQSIITKSDFKDIDLSKDCVFALPWKLESVINTIKNISYNEFEYMKNNHKSYYFKPVDICYVYNGIHSISAGMNYKKGIIKSRVCDITPLFNHIWTDGAYWYNVHTNEVKDELFDFRAGLLFEVTKMRYKLKNE